MMKKIVRIIFIITTLIISTISSFSQNGLRNFINGERLQAKEKYSASIKRYSKAIKKEPLNKEYRVKRAKSYRKVGKYNEALNDINKSISIDKNYKEAHYEKGSICAIKRDYNNAIQEFSLAIDIDSTYSEAFCGRGAVYHLSNQYDKALNDYMKSLQLGNFNRIIYYNIGLTLNDMGNYDKALEYLNEAIRIVDNSQQAFYERGRSLYEMKEYNLAEINYHKAAIFNNKLDPWEKINNGRSYYYKGLCNLQLEDTLQACNDFTEAIDYKYADAEFQYLNCNCTERQLENIESANSGQLNKKSDTTLVNIYPNPIASYATISTSVEFRDSDLQLQVFSEEGIIKYSNKIGYSYVFNRQEFPNGTYIFIIRNKGDIIARQKVIFI